MRRRALPNGVAHRALDGNVAGPLFLRGGGAVAARSGDYGGAALEDNTYSGSSRGQLDSRPAGSRDCSAFTLKGEVSCEH